MNKGPKHDPVDEIAEEDFSSPAELFVSRGAGSKRGRLGYHRFDTVSAAIEFAVERYAKLRPDDLVMTVENKRFNLGTLRVMHRGRLQRGTPEMMDPTEEDARR